MNPPLTDNIWQRKGVSVIWDVDALASLGPLSEAISLRDFFLWDADGWSKTSPNAKFSGNGSRMIVAGLEAALDAMNPEDAMEWMSERLLPVISRCCDAVFSGAHQGALIFWMVVPQRFRVGLLDSTVYWRCDGEHRDEEIKFSHGLWNGAYKDVQRIAPAGCGNPDLGIGFYLQRIS
jgi:hypothetical protein